MSCRDGSTGGQRAAASGPRVAVASRLCERRRDLLAQIAGHPK
jgi:hypothetical protein